MASAYVVQISNTVPGLSATPNGYDTVVVYANSSADAIAMAQALWDGDGMFAEWANATANLLNAGAVDLTGYSMRARVCVNATGGADSLDVTVTADGSGGVKATGTLTGDGTVVSDGDTVTIGSKVYTLQATLTNVDGHVKIVSADPVSTLTNLFHAINGTGGVSGTDYAAATVANTDVVATNPSGTTVVLTELAFGVAGNSVATTETSTHLSFGATTLTGGVTANSFDTLAAQMVTALNASGVVSHAAYNSSTNVLSVAGTADNLGDHTLAVEFWRSAAADKVSIPGFIGTITHQGSAGAALTVALPADAYTIPSVPFLLCQQGSIGL